VLQLKHGSQDISEKMISHHSKDSPPMHQSFSLDGFQDGKLRLKLKLTLLLKEKIKVFIK
jgi:hypothetical protein